MKHEIASGIGILLVVLPALSMGVTYADTGQWSSVADLRIWMILLGTAFLLWARIASAREGRVGVKGPPETAPERARRRS